MKKVNLDNGKGGTETSRWIMLLDEYINKIPRARAYASKAGYCPTANWFMGHVEESGLINGVAKLYQGIGNGVESEFIKAAERNKILLGSQVRLPTPSGIELGGYIDLIAIDQNEQPALYEIKTCKELPNKIKPEHAAQVAAYWIFSGIEKCHVIYSARKVQNWPDQTPLIKVIEFDPSLYEQYIFNVFMTLKTFNGSLPPQRPDGFRINVECTYCNFQHRCWNDHSTKFIKNTEMTDIQRKADRLMKDTLEQRNNFIPLTLKSAYNTCPESTKQILNKFIKYYGG